MCNCPQEFELNRALIAEFHRVTPKTILEWQKEGLPVKVQARGAKGNTYCVRCVSEWRTEWLMDSGTLDYTAERARLAKLQADRIAHELEVTNGNFISIEIADCAWTKLALAVRSRLLAMPTRLAPQMVGHQKAIEPFQILTTAVREALEELSSKGAETMGEYIDRKHVAEIWEEHKQKIEALKDELAETFSTLFLDLSQEEVHERWQEFVSERLAQIEQETFSAIAAKAFPVGDWQ